MTTVANNTHSFHCLCADCLKQVDGKVIATKYADECEYPKPVRPIWPEDAEL